MYSVFRVHNVSFIILSNNFDLCFVYDCLTLSLTLRNQFVLGDLWDFSLLDELSPLLYVYYEILFMTYVVLIVMTYVVLTIVKNKFIL